jgi:HEAT repeat protein
MAEELQKINFEEILTALVDQDRSFPAKLLRGFSDLSLSKLRKLLPIWVTLPPRRKVSLLEDLEEIAERDTLVNFEELAKGILSDPDPAIRVMAIRLLWETDDAKIVPTMVDIMFEDPDEATRAGAAGFLGRFVYQGELDTIPDSLKISIVRNLLEVMSGEDLPQVKQRALESLGYSSHPKIPALIQTAMDSNETLWVSTALCAMGRSADERWVSQVLEQIDSTDHEVQYEAIRACGELGIESSVDHLLNLLEEENVDPDIRLAAIWSLSQIGGVEAKEKLVELLETSEDDEELDWVEQALDNMEYSAESNALGLLKYKPNDDDDDPDDDSDELFELDQEDDSEEEE